ncbi:TnsA endonuclease-like protein [Paraburkholderia sp. BL6669N2]|uniref:TnsA endonuclease N-terminal domain-containing protein n=1 Tax=Paraburkholderia sp. BL6669N2 TaxID=1938807 RepID=UPI000E24CB29|nr:TnsA endonuclease N-terminal domain-containing protein [Paraburkholderia sp. BL6669N2]REG52091.1 TnsA endonuclease-like protein [Paraburkholderia sp. BL6669N2]
MGRGQKKMTEALIKEWQAEGRGRGEGGHYKPWLEAFDISSLGRVSRPYSAKCGRSVHLLSDVEANTFYALEWSQRVTGIREEYPLDRELTLEIAAALGIAHPYYPGTKVPTVMTVDFLVDFNDQGETRLEALDCKRTEDSDEPRQIEKLQITRTYFAGMDVPHRLVFHSELPMQKIRNIEWIRGGMVKTGEEERYAGALHEQSLIMSHDLAGSTRNQPLQEYCRNFEHRQGLNPGEGLRIAKLLMYERILTCDLGNPDLASAPLASFRCTLKADNLRAAGGR